MLALQSTTHLPTCLGFERFNLHDDAHWLPAARPRGSLDQTGCSRPQLAQDESAFFTIPAESRRLTRARCASAFLAPGLSEANLREPINSNTAASSYSRSAGRHQRAASPQEVGPPVQQPAMSRPIIFQDVDGVLNRYDAGAPLLEDGLISNLARVVKSTSANLVISSQWRKYPDDHMPRLKEALSKAEIESESIIGQTPVLCSAWQCRAREIAEFLQSHPALGHAGWVAVDDMDLEKQDAGFMHGHFVKTDSMDGLTQERADELQSMLKSDAATSVLLPEAGRASMQA